mgnify:CR=1 FL=1
MSEEILTKESEEDGTEREDSSDVIEESTDLVEVDLDQILEYAYDEGIEADKVDAWIAENFITEEGDEEEEDEEEVEEVAPVCVVGFGSVVESSGSTVMSEGGSSDSFTFALASQPGSSVVVSVVSSDLSEASVSTSSLTFSPSNWDVPQSVTVTGVNDGLGDGDQSVNIVLSADGFEDVLVGATNIDNE